MILSTSKRPTFRRRGRSILNNVFLYLVLLFYSTTFIWSLALIICSVVRYLPSSRDILVYFNSNASILYIATSPAANLYLHYLLPTFLLELPSQLAHLYAIKSYFFAISPIHLIYPFGIHFPGGLNVRWMFPPLLSLCRFAIIYTL